MSQERNFPFLLWEDTEQFRQEAEIAQQRLENATKQLKKRSFKGLLTAPRFDVKGYPSIWLSGCPDIPHHGLPLEKAKKLAWEWGSTGWWGLDESEGYVHDKNIIFETAMYDFGFRKHKSIKGQWASKGKRDTSPYQSYLDSKYPVPSVRFIKGEELEELFSIYDVCLGAINQLEKGNKRSNGFCGKSYGIYVDHKSRVVFDYWDRLVSDVYPQTFFPSRNMGDLGLITRINPEQDNFFLEAEEIVLKKGMDPLIHLKALPRGSDVCVVEAIWPRRLSVSTLDTLARSFVKGVRGCF